MINVHLLPHDSDDRQLPRAVSVELSRVPCVGEFIRVPDAEGPPYRVTKVQHYPIGMGQCDAEVWCVVDESVPL